MKSTLLSGQEPALEMLQSLRKKIAERRVQLAVVQVGKNLVSSTYIQKKKEAALQAGIAFLTYPISAQAAQKDIMSLVARLGENSAISGIVVQLPLPPHLNSQKILDCIPAEKDPDVLSSRAFGRFALGQSSILPPTVSAMQKLFKTYCIQIAGKRIALVGSGRLVGLPLLVWLAGERATVMNINRKTKNPAALIRQADIVISGTGMPGLIKGSMIKKGAIVVDLGTSVEQGKTAGDVDFKSVAKKAKAVTPVPGGVGPLTIACLLDNLVTLSAWTSKS
ncbi:MAG TPA: bifunctional 5,10-methylenetetrahydrofolate dehydrogenase/5,10-methenyltetrahydrofolate cyclohydrolase [Candidatus Paceibacterota bacterium]